MLLRHKGLGRKKGALIPYLYLLSHLVSFNITFRISFHLALKFDAAKGRKDKYFLEDRIYNIIELRGSQPFQTIIIVSSIISSPIIHLCLLITDISRILGQHPTLLKVSSITFKVVRAACSAVTVSNLEICAANFPNTVFKPYS